MILFTVTYLLFGYFSRGVISKSSPFGTEVCAFECVKRVAVSSNNVPVSESCARGCRFFNIAQTVFDGNSTRDVCASYCDESYAHSDVDLLCCKTGCKTAVPWPPIQIPLIAQVSWSLFIDSGEGGSGSQAWLETSAERQQQQFQNIESSAIKQQLSRIGEISKGVFGGWCGSSASSDYNNTNNNGGPLLSHCLLGSLLLMLVALGLLLGLMLEDSSLAVAAATGAVASTIGNENDNKSITLAPPRQQQDESNAALLAAMSASSLPPPYSAVVSINETDDSLLLLVDGAKHNLSAIV